MHRWKLSRLDCPGRAESLKVRKVGLPPLFPITRAKQKSSQMREKPDLGDEKWRVFCAVALPGDLHERLTTHINRIRDIAPDARARWSRADNIHLTLKFLGDISLPRVEKLSEAASRSVEDFAPFKIVLEQTGVFPPHGSPRVLWIGVNDLEGKLGQVH